MKQVKTWGLIVVAVGALSAIAATATEASEGPFFKVNGARLAAGEKLETSGKGQTGYTMEVTGISIQCTGQTGAKGSAMIGSSGGNAGTGEAKPIFEGCKLIGNGEKCRLAAADKGIITTEAVKSALAYPKSVPSKGDILLVLFQPATGTVFTKIKVEAEVGGKCTVEGTLAVEGTIAAEAWDSSKNPIKLEEESAEAEISYVNFPIKGTEACTEAAKAVKCIKPKLTIATKTGKLVGRSEGKLTSKQKWGIFGK